MMSQVPSGCVSEHEALGTISYDPTLPLGQNKTKPMWRWRENKWGGGQLRHKPYLGYPRMPGQAIPDSPRMARVDQALPSLQD